METLRTIITDPTIIVYFLCMLSSFYGSILFLWWWLRQGQASSVFIYVTLIFFGEFIESAVCTIARTLLALRHFNEHSIFITSWIWPTRKGATLLAILFIVIHMSIRIYSSIKSVDRTNAKF
jgi:hypothetical protein